jgi:predicted restriction endonuclease
MANNKTFKYEPIDDSELERIKVEPTKKVDVNALFNDSNNSELTKLSKEELQYKLQFEDLDKSTRKRIKELLKNK